MFHRIAGAIAIAALTLSVPAVAKANSSTGHAFDRDDDDDDRRGGHHGPEPLTMIGLGIGAAGIVSARWAYRRRMSRKG